MSDPRELEIARRELQRLGYLSHRVERFLLRDALEPVGRSARPGAPRGEGRAARRHAAGARQHAGARGGQRALRRRAGRSPAALPPPPAAAGRSRRPPASSPSSRASSSRSSSFPRRSLEWLILGVTFVATALLFGWAVLRASDLLLGLPRWQRVVAGIALPLVAAAVAKLLADGLLSIAIRLTRMTPRERLVSRRTILAVTCSILAIVAAVAFVVPQRAPAAAPRLAAERGRRARPAGRARRRSRRRVRLPARAGRPAGALGACRARGRSWRATRGRRARAGRVLDDGGHRRRRRPPRRRSLDSFRPAGLADGARAQRALATLVVRRRAVPLGLAEHRPLLANRRRTPSPSGSSRRAAERRPRRSTGGRPFRPSRSPGWWSRTAPSSCSLDGHLGAVAPADRAPDLARLARAIERRAFGLDPRGRAAGRSSPRSCSGARCCPTVSTARSRAGGGREPARGHGALPAGGRSARRGLDRRRRRAWPIWCAPSSTRPTRLIGELAEGLGTLVVVLDPGRRRGGRAGAGGSCFARSGAGSARPACRAGADLAGGPRGGRRRPDPRPRPAAERGAAGAAALLHLAGAAGARPGFGERSPSGELPGDSRDYLENLRSLGYL